MGNFELCKVKITSCTRCHRLPVVRYIEAPCGCAVGVCKCCSEAHDMEWWANQYARLHSYAAGSPHHPDGGVDSGCPRCHCKGRLVPKVPKPAK